MISKEELAKPVTWGFFLAFASVAISGSWAINMMIRDVMHEGVVRDMSNTDAMLGKRIDSIESRLNAWKNTAENQ